MPALVTLGDCCIDTYLPPAARAYAGGSAPNVAVAASAAGLASGCAGVVGTDRAGQELLRLLVARGVDTAQIAPCPGQTRRVPIRITPQGHQFAHEFMPPRRPFQPTPEMLAYARGAQWAHLNWLDDPLQALPALAAPGGPRLSLDYGARSSAELQDATLPFVHVAFFAREPGESGHAAELARAAASRGPALVVITLGAAGSLAWDGRSLVRQPAVAVNAADAVGAGDSFIGAFLAAQLQRLPLAASLESAAQAAANTCTHPGSWPGAEIDPSLLPPEEHPW